MAPCTFSGNTDMYGLGIRLGFYFQWFCALLARSLVPTESRDHRKDDPIKDEIRGLRFSIKVFSAATFLALVILIVQDVSSLQIVEIYIVLLLTFGYSLALVPIYLWRLLTLCSPRLDPTRWPMVRLSSVENYLTFLLNTAVSSFQLWFWFARVPQLNSQDCQEYGFLLAKIGLNVRVMQVLHILLYFLVLLSCITMLLRSTAIHWHILEEDVESEPVSPSRKAFLQNLNIILGLVIAASVVTATELTIKWNNIQGVDTLASAGQTIPFAIGLASIVRIMYVYLFKDPNPHNGEPQRSNTSDEQPIGRGDLPMDYARPLPGRRPSG